MERLVAVPSYLKEDDDYPHVPAIKKVLDETMALMKDLGYRTYADPDGYYGWAEIGEGDTLIGVLGHLDVVPPGLIDDWKSDPFTVNYRDGKAYGRGVQDDKGPTLTAVYAVKALLDEGFTPNYRLRFILAPMKKTSGAASRSIWKRGKPDLVLRLIPFSPLSMLKRGP